MLFSLELAAAASSPARPLIRWRYRWKPAGMTCPSDAAGVP
jgi:hypothetical protein